MDGDVVLIGGRAGILVVLLATGGNSPFAEREYNTFIYRIVLSFPFNKQRGNPIGVTLKLLDTVSARPLTATENVEPPAGVILSFVSLMAIQREWNARNIQHPLHAPPPTPFLSAPTVDG